MSIKRYEPGAYGAMNESEDGKYYHKRDVDELIKLADSLLNNVIVGNHLMQNYYSEEIEVLKKWGVK